MKMNFILKSTLKHNSLTKIAVELWNQENDMIEISSSLNDCKFEDKWEKVEDKIVEKVRKLSLPEKLKTDLLCFIKLIGLQIYEWHRYNFLKCGLEGTFSKQLSWTPQGTIDMKKTSRVLMTSESLNDATRYKIACLYCLEEQIPEVWKRLDPDGRRFRITTNKLVLFWTYCIKGERSRLKDLIMPIGEQRPTPHQIGFYIASGDSNPVATEYFFKKLSPVEKKLALSSVEGVLKPRMSVYFGFDRINCPNQFNNEVACFMLDQMSEDERGKVFEKCPQEVLSCFLEWPRQSLYLETVNRVWDFMCMDDFASALTNISEKIRYNWNDCSYRYLLRRVWQRSCAEKKKHFINLYSFWELLRDLFFAKEEDEELVRLFLNDANSFGPKGLVVCDGAQHLYSDLKRENKWRWLKFMLSLLVPSKEAMVTFKKIAMSQSMLQWSECSEECRRREDTFFHLLDDIIADKSKVTLIPDDKPS